MGNSFLVELPKTLLTFAPFLLVILGRRRNLLILFSLPVISCIVDNIVTGPLSIHNTAKTSSTTTPESVSHSKFLFFILRTGGNPDELVRTVPHAPIPFSSKNLNNLILEK